MNATKATMSVWMRGLLAAGLAVGGAAATARADTQTIGGVAWTYSLAEHGAILTKADPAIGYLSVPATLGGQPVVEIGYGAFASCEELTAVTIPQGLESIGNYAFYRCTGLTSVTIPDSVAKIGGSAFDGCTSTLFDTNSIPGVCLVDGWAVGCSGTLKGAVDLTGIRGIAENAFAGCYGLTSATIPDSVTSIGDSAFSGCRGLASVTIPDSVVSIGAWAFSDCSGLMSVTIPDNMTSIGDSAFYRCTGLSSVTFPDSVDTIGDSAFYNCRGLTSVTIGNGVRSIGARAFYNCSALMSVKIGDSVTDIGRYAFSGCTNLTAVYINDLAAWCGIEFRIESTNPLYYARHLYLNGKEVAGDLVIPGGVKSIGNYAFCYCTNLTSVTIPDSLTSIGTSAFYYCTNLSAVYINDLGAWCEIEFVDQSANPLYYALHLYLDGEEVAGELVIPDGVTNIGWDAFSGCRGLTSVTIPDSVMRIEGTAFVGCSGLTAVYIHDLAAWCGIEFGGNYANPLYYARHLYLDGKEVAGDLAIPDGVTNIGWHAFSGCTNLTSVMIPDSVTSIGNGAFEGCSGLSSVRISDSVTSIGGSAFYNCSGLTSVTIPDGVVSIGNEAFYNCYRLTSVTIPDSVTSIGDLVFSGCSGLRTLYVPESWKTKYVGGEFWSDYARVPSDCEIIYYAPPKTRTGVPYAWLAGYGLGDGTAEGCEAAAAADAANRAFKVWECYVAGLDPTNPAATFTAAIAFTNGSPVVSWTPDLNEKGTKSQRSYEVQGKPTMTNAWGATNSASRFFRVKVTLP